MKNLDEALYRKIKLIREIENSIIKIYPTDNIKSPIHLSVGHEAIAVGVCHALKDSDAIFGYYRSHAIYLAKGGNLDSMMAELYGKVDGCAKGWGGSMHLVDTEVNVNSTTAIVASSIPNAVGYAYGIKLNKSDQVVVSFFGDGATEEGVFWESLNFAALHKLPIIFVCENNDLAIHTKQKDRQAQTVICDKVRAFGIESCSVIGSDSWEIYEISRKIIENVRSAKGPYFIEARVARWLEHVGPNEDWNLGYRNINDIETWKKQDGVVLAGNRLAPDLREKIDHEISEQIKKSILFAENSEFPKSDNLLKYVYR